MSESGKPSEATPEEVASIALKILTLVNEHISTTPELLTAALRVASTTVDETRNAEFGARLRATMTQQYGRRT